MKIDTSTWKHFKIGDYFDIHPTKAYTGLSNKDLNDGGETPFVVNSAANNGIGGFSTKPATEKGNIITFSDTTEGNTFFYQPHDFIGFSHVQGMYEKNHAWTRNQLLFLVSVLKFTCVGRYTYGRKMTRENIAASLVLLPSDEYGLPDWQWMESYIDSLHSEPLTTQNDVHVASFDTTVWKWFQLGGEDGLFDIRKGKRLTSEDQTDGNTPYIGAIDSNNGVSNLIGQSPIHEGNTISLSYNGSVGEAFYQPLPYWATDDVNALYLRPENGTLCPATGLFICSVLKHDKYRYSYGRKWTLDNMNDTKIKLPATPDGKPDWQWMESYIKSLPYGDRL